MEQPVRWRIMAVKEGGDRRSEYDRAQRHWAEHEAEEPEEQDEGSTAGGSNLEASGHIDEWLARLKARKRRELAMQEQMRDVRGKGHDYYMRSPGHRMQLEAPDDGSVLGELFGHKSPHVRSYGDEGEEYEAAAEHGYHQQHGGDERTSCGGLEHLGHRMNYGVANFFDRGRGALNNRDIQLLNAARRRAQSTQAFKRAQKRATTIQTIATGGAALVGTALCGPPCGAIGGALGAIGGEIMSPTPGESLSWGRLGRKAAFGAALGGATPLLLTAWPAALASGVAAGVGGFLESYT